MRKGIVYIITTIWSIVAFSQVPGRWNEYFSFHNVQQLEGIDENIFALSENGIFIYNTNTKEIQKITKLDGLSTVSLTCMAFCDSTSSFLIGYSDGTLDILEYPSFVVRSIPTIANKSIYGSKRINAIVMHNDTAIIATEFGVLTFSMTTKNFIATAILSDDGNYIPAKSVATDDTSIFAATTKGIFSAPISNTNISDFSTWKKLEGIPYGNDTISHIATLNGTIYYAHKNTTDTSKDSVFKINNGKAGAFKTQFDNITRIKTNNGNLILLSSATANIYNGEEHLKNSVHRENDLGDFTDIVYMESFLDSYISNTKFGIFDTKGNNKIYPKSPQSNAISDVVYDDERLYLTEGKLINWEGAMFDYMDYLGNWYSHKIWDVQNARCVFVPKKSSTFYYGSFGGLVLGNFSQWWKADTIYNHTNSSIQQYQFYAAKVDVVSDITNDSKNNIWFLNEYSSYPLMVITPGNEWHQFLIPSIGRMSFEDILIDTRGIKWLAGESKLIAYYENETIDDDSDDLCVQIPLTDAEGTIAAHTTCITEDLDGDIWIGTNQGIAVHSAPARVFRDRQTISRIKIEIDGEVGYLLSSEGISSIAVDGANRKWIGTENSGVFLISENGTEQLLNFTKTNSPLPSNTITAISINNETGEVFIGTDAGLISYIGDATKGDITMSNVTVYPNPVRESYEGDIFIKGVVADAIIKITDVSGNLVQTITANGGTAVWNGRNHKGNKVNTGIYLFYISDETGEYTKIGKILVIN